ncbi:MAG: hypothetical protein LBE15_01645, partial [Burkholderiales bacterium]|nr:hypothetical protein [Burkholderiales bacterium]
GGSITNHVFGGTVVSVTDGTVETGHVNITGSATVGGWVIGGDAEGGDSATAFNNVAYIRGGSTVSVGGVNGGLAESVGTATASSNSAYIGDALGSGTVNGGVWGGEANGEDGADASSNDVELFDGEVATDVFGGAAVSANGPATASSNIVMIRSNGVVVDGGGGGFFAGVFGGLAEAGGADAATASSNEVSVFGEVDYVRGGSASNSDTGDAIASNNEVTVDGGTLWVDIIGGNVESDSGDAMASGNRVIFNNSTEASITGARAVSFGTGNAAVSGSTVEIDGSTVNGVSGGYAASGTGNATVSGSTVEIDGGTVSDNIRGGEAESTHGVSTATNNTVTIRGTPTFNNVSLIGGEAADVSTGNVLNLYSHSLTVNGLEYFQTINFHLPSSKTTAHTMLTVNNPVDLTGIAFEVFLDGTGPRLRQGDRFTLIAGVQPGTFAERRGLSFTGNRVYDLEQIGNDLVMIIVAVPTANNVTTPVPTTGSGVLIALGVLLAGLGAVRLRRRSGNRNQ